MFLSFNDESRLITIIIIIIFFFFFFVFVITGVIVFLFGWFQQVRYEELFNDVQIILSRVEADDR